MSALPLAPAGSGAHPADSREAWRIGSTVNAIALTLMLGCLVVAAVVITLADPLVRLLALGMVAAASALAMLLVRRGHPWAGSLLLVGTLYGAVTGGLFVVGSIYNPAIVG